jgi:hypothetical protein
MSEKSHFTPQFPGIGEADWPARDRIVSRAMMRGGGFVLLKAARCGLETAKQAEIRLAGLLKILRIVRSGGWEGLVRDGQLVQDCIFGDFRWTWLI